MINDAGYGSPAVAEFSFSLLLNATRHTYIALQRSKKRDFHYSDIKGVELFGKTLGILGLDVISDIKYIHRNNILYTPHMAYYTKEVLERIMQISLQNLTAFLASKPLPNCLKLSCRRDY